MESYLRDFADDSPHVTVAMLRCANVLGTDIVTPITQALSLPVVPSIFGFDPLVQFLEEDDVVRALEYAMRENRPGSTTWPATGGCRGARWRPWSAARSGRCRRC